MQAVDLKCEIARKRQQCRKGTFNLETDFLNLSQLTNSLLCYYHILAVRLWTIHLTFLGLSNHHKTFSCSNFVSVVSVNRYNWNNVLHKDQPYTVLFIMGVMFDTIIFFALYCFYYYFANINNQITTKSCDYFLVLSLIHFPASSFRAATAPRATMSSCLI